MPSVKKPRRTRRSTYIKAWREFRGLTQEKAAEGIGISRENYGRVESAKVPYNQDFLEMFADFIGCSVGDLLERDPVNDSPADRMRAVLSSASPADQERALRVVKTLIQNSD